MHVLRKPRRRGSRAHERDERKFRWGFLGNRSVELEHLGRLVRTPGHEATDDLRTDRVERVIDAGHDAEVPATTPQTPEKVSVLVVARVHQPCVGSYDIHPHNVVRRPAPTPRQVSEPAAQGESRNTGERNETENGSKPVHLRFAIHFAEQATSLRVGDLSLWVHPDAAHERHVEHHRAVGRGQARDVVSSAFEAEQNIGFARELHAREHVGNAEAARDDGGPSIDHGVPDRSGLLKAHVARSEHRPPEALLQTVESVLVKIDLPTFRRCRPHGWVPCRSTFEACVYFIVLLLYCIAPNETRSTAAIGRARRRQGKYLSDLGS